MESSLELDNATLRGEYVQGTPKATDVSQTQYAPMAYWYRILTNHWHDVIVCGS